MTRRQSLVKIVPRRFVPDSELASIGGNQYTTSFVPKEPEAVYRGTTSLAFTWSNGVLTITTATAPDSNIFADYPLYFCTESVINTYDDPVSQTGSVIDWLPRMQSHPTFSNSIDNGLSGLITISNNNIVLINEDFGLNKYFTVYDNYKNRPFNLYALLGETYYNHGDGYTSSVSIGKRISFRVKNPTKLLDSKATLGNTSQFLQWSTSNYTFMDPALVDYPIMCGFGVGPKFIPNSDADFYINNTTGFGSTNLRSDAGLFRAPYLGFFSGKHHFGLGLVENPWTGTSSWITPNTPTLVSGYFAGAINSDATRYTVPSADMKYLMPTMNLLVQLNSGSTTTMIIHAVDYNNNTILTENDTTANPVVRIYRSSFHIWRRSVYGGLQSRGGLLPGNTTFSTSTNGYKLGFFQLSSAPGDDDEYFYTFTHAPKDQADVIQEYIEGAGLTVNASSFSAAQTEINSQVMMSVNPVEENNLDVIQKITSSCGGIVYQDDLDGDYRYKIINDSISGVDWTLVRADILEPQLLPEISYQDVSSSLNLKFSYLPDNSVYIPGINAYSESTFSALFNTEEKTSTIDHVLLNPVNAQDTKEQAYFSPRISYTFEIDSVEFFTMQVGDVVRLTEVSDMIVIGNNDYIDLLVTAINKSPQKIEVRGYDFKKIP